jgi:hypothetical protein
MKTILLTVLVACLALLFSAAALRGQAGDSFATMTVAEFKVRVAAAEATGIGVVKYAVVESAFRSRRVDLVEICYDSNLGYLEASFDMEPPSDFKNDLFLMILSKPWSSDSPHYDGVAFPEISKVEMIQQYLPEVAAAIISPDHNLRLAVHGRYFSNAAAREKFAVLFRQAIAAKKAGLPPPSVPPLTPFVSTRSPEDSVPPTPPAAAPTVPAKSASPLKWMAAAATLTALALGWRALRRK